MGVVYAINVLVCVSCCVNISRVVNVCLATFVCGFMVWMITAHFVLHVWKVGARMVLYIVEHVHMALIYAVSLPITLCVSMVPTVIVDTEFMITVQCVRNATNVILATHVTIV